jgi:hypothetical protein
MIRPSLNPDRRLAWALVLVGFALVAEGIRVFYSSNWRGHEFRLGFYLSVGATIACAGLLLTAGDIYAMRHRSADAAFWIGIERRVRPKIAKAVVALTAGGVVVTIVSFIRNWSLALGIGLAPVLLGGVLILLTLTVDIRSSQESDWREPPD